MQASEKKDASPSSQTALWTEDACETVFQTICERLAFGESLRAICQSAGMPSVWTVLRWVREKPGFAQQYAHARELQAEFYADSIVNIADAAEDPQLARLQIDARKWIASKLLPKKYGERHVPEAAVKDPEAQERLLAEIVEDLRAIQARSVSPAE